MTSLEKITINMSNDHLMDDGNLSEKDRKSSVIESFLHNFRKLFQIHLREKLRKYFYRCMFVH